MHRYARDVRVPWDKALAQPEAVEPMRARLNPFKAGKLSSLLLGGAVVLVCGALLIPALNSPVSEMDEGAVLAYGQLVNEGEVPGRDFETFYGPGEPWLAAASFDVAGPSVGVERALGLAARLIILTAIFALALRWGIIAAASATAISSLAMYPVGVGAFAFWSALAPGLGGLALLVRSSGKLSVPALAKPEAEAEGPVRSAAALAAPGASRQASRSSSTSRRLPQSPSRRCPCSSGPAARCAWATSLASCVG